MCAEIPELNYGTRVGNNEPGSIMWLATKQLKKSTTAYVILVQSQRSIFIFYHFNVKGLVKTLKLKLDSWQSYAIRLGCSCSETINFSKLTFKPEIISLILFLTKISNIHFKHENQLSIYQNMNHFQIMWVTVTCTQILQIALTIDENIFSIFFNTNDLEMFLKWIN